MRTKSGFFGVYPMVYALFDERGNLAREPMRRQVLDSFGAITHLSPSVDKPDFGRSE